MALPTYTIITIAILMSCWTGFGASLRVVVNPQPFDDRTNTLSISCIAEGRDYLDKAISSIQIMKESEGKTIAVVNMRQELKMGNGMKDNMKANGRVHSNSSNSFLTLTIEKPGRQDAGVYKCQVFFTGENFQIMEEHETGNVTYHGQEITKTISILVATVKKQGEELERQNKEMEMFKKYHEQQDQKIDALEMLIKNLMKRVPTTATTTTTTTPTPATTTKSTSTPTACPEGWKFYKNDNTCNKNFGTNNSSNRLSWYKAREACQSYGGDLVQVKNFDKSWFVYNMAKNLAHYYVYTWIGLRNEVSDGYKFQYVDGSDLGSYGQWENRQPDGSGDGDEKCVVLNTGRGNVHYWRDERCSRTYPYVCSIPPSRV